MGTTLTTNYNLIKPNPFEEEDTWGSLLNTNLDSIDTILFGKQAKTTATTALAAVTPAADTMPYFTSGSAAAVATITAFARTLLAGASAAAVNTTLGLGTANIPTFSGLTINGSGINISSNNNFEPQVALTHGGATAGSAPYFIAQRARGTYLSPTIVSSGDTLGQLYFAGHDGTTYRQAAIIRAVVDGTPGASDMPTSLVFLVTPDGSGTSVERMRIDPNGEVGIGTSAPAAKLHVAGASETTAAPTDAGTKGSTILVMGGSEGVGSGGVVAFGAFGNTFAAIKAWATNGTANGTGDLIFSTRGALVDTALTERMRIDAAGSVGIGTSTALGVYGKLRVGGVGYQALNVGSDIASGVNVIVAANAASEARIGTATNHPLHLYANNAARVIIDASGNVGIGATPITGPKLQVSGAITVTGGLSVDLTSTGAMDFSAGHQSFLSYGSGGVQGGYRWFSGTDNTIGSIRMQLDTSGVLTVGGGVLVNAAGGLGYGTGSGGTVTQATSKTTGVTLNKTNGQVITSNSLMGGGAELTFTVTNSAVAATDVVQILRASGGGAGGAGYTVSIDSVAAGSFVVYMKNLSATSKSDVVTMNFAITKAVIS